MRAVLVVDFEDDLILIVWLLDQVDVVLRISGTEETLEFRGGDAIHAGPIAIDIDVEVRLIAKEIRARGRDEAVVLGQPGAERVGRRVDFIGVDPAERVTVAAELASGGTYIDLENRRRIEGRENPRELAEAAAQIHRDFLNRRTLLDVPQKEDRENAGRTGAPAASDGKIFVDRRIALQNRIKPLLHFPLLLRRCAFLH